MKEGRPDEPSLSEGNRALLRAAHEELASLPEGAELSPESAATLEAHKAWLITGWIGAGAPAELFLSPDAPETPVSPTE